jgi:demethylmenaquinone methyltransferase/2-methoxy-6-polyprenyl-1,4-benzoquinol methylase
MASGIPAIPETILQEQQVYYRERAAEYDQWWLRVGRYDRGADENAIWFSEQEEVRAALDAADWSGEVLELAGGTGIWTAWLAERATSVTVLDGAPEMIAINQQRLTDAGLAERVSFQQVDLFDWQPDRQYDALFIGYFLSHVPAERLDGFLSAIASALRPGGRFGMLDGRRDERSSSPDQPPPTEEEHVMTRRLNDGRTFQIVKRYDEPKELEAALARHGIRAHIQTTATHYLYGTGTRDDGTG